MKQADADRLEERMIDFGAAIIGATEQFPRTYAGAHVANQLLRSGTSPAPQYGEARGAESRADFIHKMSVGLKELNESRIWLRMAVKSRLLSQGEDSAALIDEASQLARILNASIRTARTAGPKSAVG